MVFWISERQVGSIVKANRKMVRYRSYRASDTALRERLRELATERRRFGYRRLVVLLRREAQAQFDCQRRSIEKEVPAIFNR